MSDNDNNTTSKRETKMTYGIKKASSTPNGTPSLLTTSGDWILARFVGVGSNHAAKQWKTEAAARRVAAIRGGAVFLITKTTMDY
jgi:hypothetical protein